MTKTCIITGKQFTISEEEKAHCHKFGVPLPNICPEERMRQVMAARNERSLYHRTCDATGKNIISAYAPGTKFPVYENSIWWGDSWDAVNYGREFDFSKPFFTQFEALQTEVPREGTSIFNSENCAYNSHIRESKNCYMNALALHNEDCFYGYWTIGNKDIMDCMYTHQSSLCYECSEVRSCYECAVLQESTNCNECFFSYQLRNCKNCIFCSNLVNKSFYAFNKPCSEEEFMKLKKKHISGSYSSWQQAYEDFLALREEAIHRENHNINCENVLGDHLYDSRNCTMVFDGHDNEDCWHTVSVGQSKNVFDSYSIGWPACEMIYLSSVARGCTDIAFCMHVWFCSNLRYCDSCVSCHDCFGCVGLKHKKYCILNKQYSQEEYETLVPRIIAHMKTISPNPSLEKRGTSPPPRRRGLRGIPEWGQFFPVSCIPFAYNETAGQDQMPLQKEDALQRGWEWKQPEEHDYSEVIKKITANKLPDSIQEVSDDILHWTILCNESKRPFKIQKAELQLYRKMKLPIPRLHPDIRHAKRMSLRNPRKLWQRNCDNCQKEMQTTYSPERQETVYCEECYLKTVY